MKHLLCVLSIMSLTLAAQAAESPVIELAPDDAAYEAIVKVLEVAVSEDVGQAVMLVVDQIRVQDAFAFVAADTVNPDGSAIDFKTTTYADAVSSGLFDGPHLWAYLKSVDGEWTVLEQDIGPTDAYFAYWPEAHGGSCTLTGLGPDC